VPIIIRSIYETDIDWQVWVNSGNRDLEGNENRADIIRNFTPRLYYIGNRKTIFTYTNYAIWLSISIIHSLIIFLGTYFIFKTTILDKDGKNAGLWSFSVTMFFSIILAINIRLMVTQRLINLFNFISVTCFSLLLYYAYNWGSNYTSISKTYLTSEQLHVSPIFYFTIFLCSGLIFLLDLFYETILVNLMQSPSQYMRKAVNDNKILPEGWEEEFDWLQKKKDKKYTMQDLKREKHNGILFYWIILNKLIYSEEKREKNG